jgi:hypothetical protein
MGTPNQTERQRLGFRPLRRGSVREGPTLTASIAGRMIGNRCEWGSCASRREYNHFWHPYPWRTRALPLEIYRTIKCLIVLAPRAGFEPATNRLTAGGCEVGSSPDQSPRRSSVRRDCARGPGLATHLSNSGMNSICRSRSISSAFSASACGTGRVTRRVRARQDRTARRATGSTVGLPDLGTSGTGDKRWFQCSTIPGSALRSRTAIAQRQALAAPRQ